MYELEPDDDEYLQDVDLMVVEEGQEEEGVNFAFGWIQGNDEYPEGQLQDDSANSSSSSSSSSSGDGRSWSDICCSHMLNFAGFMLGTILTVLILIA